MSMRRRGIERLARRNAERRFGVFGSMILAVIDIEGFLFDFAVQGVPAEERIVLLLLEAVGGVRALFIARGGVPGRGLPLGLGLGALDRDDVSGHGCLFLGFADGFF